MPNVEFFYDNSLVRDSRGSFPVDGDTRFMGPVYVRDQIRPIIAGQMDCFDLEEEWLRHTAGQIKFLTFAPFPDSGDTALVVMRIAAFNWPDRMRNIDERLERICEDVRNLLQLPIDTVDASFIELQHPSPTRRACWVRR